MPVCLKIFSVDNKYYLLTIFTEEDDRTEVTDENENIVLTFTANCYIQKDGFNIGYLSQNSKDHICFTFKLDSPHRDLIDTNIIASEMDAYFKAEIEITKYYLNMLKESNEENV